MDGDLVIQAVLWYAEKSIDFIDAFNAAWMSSQEVETILTFDGKHFSRFEVIEVVVPGEVGSG